jgi:hypothetical protein
LFKKTDSGTRYVQPAFKERIEELAPKWHSYTYQITQHIRAFLFRPCYHPYMEKVLEKLNDEGFDSIFSLLDLTDKSAVFSQYLPSTNTNPPLVQAPLPEEKFYFDINEPYAQDNWLTFYHIIILIVETLLANNKVDDAIVWIEKCLYDPKAIETEPDPLHKGPNAKYWKLPIFKDEPLESTTQFFNAIADPELQDMVNDLQANPFNPFVVAYRRPQEFMMYVVSLHMKAYIAKGDVNFRMAYNGGGMDFLNLALEYYKVAKIQAGGRIETIPNILKKKPETYQTLKEKGLKPDVNALVQYENMFPFCSQNPLKSGDTSSGSLLGGGPTFYFSIPPDTAANELFDLIDDRLSKLRSGQDINGIVRKIDLFGTPINPAQILAALSKGISLNDILGSLYAPAPVFRFNFYFQKAIEACNELKAIGGPIAGAMDKRDGELLTLMRARHDTDALNRMAPIKERQVYEAELQKQGLLRTRENASNRLAYYQSLLGITSEAIPAYPGIPSEMNEGVLVTAVCISPTIADVDVSLVDGGERGVKIIPKEHEELQSMSLAADRHTTAGDLEMVGAFMNVIPGFSGHIAPIGIGLSMSVGGSNLAAVFSGIAKGYQNTADTHSYDATQAAKFSAYIRREQEWTNQANIIKMEIPPLDKQLAAFDIKIQIATKERDNLKSQLVELQEVQDFLTTKETNAPNYQLVIDKLKPVHKSFYDLAMYYAQSAEQAYQFEKPEKVIDFISYDYDASIVGMNTVADTLHLALKELEKSYLEDSQRPKEMKKTISLLRLDPIALLKLRKEGKASFKIPEWLLLLDNRGIYNAKWMSINFSLPMIIGPNINLAATVTMDKNYIRIKTTGVGNAEDFPMKTAVDGIDSRFVQSNTPFREVIISTGMNDSGFNLDLSANANEVYQQQYHPFQHAGFASEWTINLNQKDENSDFSQVNWDTLSDVIISGVLNIDTDYGEYYTGAGKYLDALLKKVDSDEPLLLFLDVKHDLPNELNLYKTQPAATQFSFSLDHNRFSYLTQNKKITIRQINVITKSDMHTSNFAGIKQIAFKNSAAVGDYSVFVSDKLFDGITDINFELKDPMPVKLELDKEKAGDTFIVLKYTLDKS